VIPLFYELQYSKDLGDSYVL